MKTRWIVEKSHKVRLPEAIECSNLDELRSTLQSHADSYIATEDHPPLGQLEYRYELDERDEPFVVYAYFYNKHGDLTRFARLAIND